MSKITFLGAGSTVFARTLLGDILSFPELANCAISLHDIDPERLRTIPVMLDMCHDMEQLCPDVWFLNYVNPMAINCWAISRATPIKTVGLCHSVQGAARDLAGDIGVPIGEINYLCAGINHMAFYLRFEHSGEDLYPRIRQVVEENRVPDWNRVRCEVLTRVGYFVTESSEHFSETVAGCPPIIDAESRTARASGYGFDRLPLSIAMERGPGGEVEFNGEPRGFQLPAAPTPASSPAVSCAPRISQM